jgi:dolichol-phosphate mannosyltransferase
MSSKNKAKKFLKYNLAGSFQFIVDLFLLWFFTEIIGFYYLVSAFISVVVSSIIGYSLNKNYVFQKSKRNFLHGYGIFLTITTVKIFVIIGILFFFVDVLKIYYLLSRILTGLIIVIIMYILHTKLTFKTDFD